MKNLILAIVFSFTLCSSSCIPALVLSQRETNTLEYVTHRGDTTFIHREVYEGDPFEEKHELDSIFLDTMQGKVIIETKNFKKY
jgi:hypothetical protein